MNHKHDDCFTILEIGRANPSTGMLKKVAELTVIEPTMCTEHQRAIAEQQHLLNQERFKAGGTTALFQSRCTETT